MVKDRYEMLDWFLKELGVYQPQQIEFARLNLTHTVMSKRKLLRLVEELNGMKFQIMYIHFLIHLLIV